MPFNETMDIVVEVDENFLLKFNCSVFDFSIISLKVKKELLKMCVQKTKFFFYNYNLSPFTRSDFHKKYNIFPL